MPADLETTVGLYLKNRDLYPQSALLESSDCHTRHNVESFVGVAPLLPDGSVIQQNTIIYRVHQFVDYKLVNSVSCCR